MPDPYVGGGNGMRCLPEGCAGGAEPRPYGLDDRIPYYKYNFVITLFPTTDYK